MKKYLDYDGLTFLVNEINKRFASKSESFTQEQKDKLNSIEEGAERNIVTSVANKTGEVILDLKDIQIKTLIEGLSADNLEEMANDIYTTLNQHKIEIDKKIDKDNLEEVISHINLSFAELKDEIDLKVDKTELELAVSDINLILSEYESRLEDKADKTKLKEMSDLFDGKLDKKADILALEEMSNSLKESIDKKADTTSLEEMDTAHKEELDKKASLVELEEVSNSFNENLNKKADREELEKMASDISLTFGEYEIKLDTKADKSEVLSREEIQEMIDASDSDGDGAVISVNGKDGIIVLDSFDIGFSASSEDGKTIGDWINVFSEEVEQLNSLVEHLKTTIPTKLSEMEDDIGYLKSGLTWGDLLN